MTIPIVLRDVLAWKVLVRSIEFKVDRSIVR